MPKDFLKNMQKEMWDEYPTYLSKNLTKKFME